MTRKGIFLVGILAVIVGYFNYEVNKIKSISNDPYIHLLHSTIDNVVMRDFRNIVEDSFVNWEKVKLSIKHYLSLVVSKEDSLIKVSFHGLLSSKVIFSYKPKTIA